MKNSVNKHYVPKLRFRGFEGEYKEIKISDVSEFYKGDGYSKKDIIDNGKYEVILYGDLFTTYKNNIEEIKYKTNRIGNKKTRNNSILFPDSSTSLNDFFPCCSIKKEVFAGSDLNIFELNINEDSLYYSYCFSKPYHLKNIFRLTEGSTINHLYGKYIAEYKLIVPVQLIEQEKISSFFNLLDKQISLLENKLKLTETLSKFNIANFFKKTSKIYNFINFKKIVILNKNKNKSNHHYDVATISNKFGFIRQKEYFGDKTNVASENKKNYYIIEKKSFGFNPARINVGSFGYYNKNEKLLISPIYVSFKINNEIFSDEIIEAYSKTYFFKQNIAKWQTGSVRKSINANDFLNFTIPLIPLKIQNVFVNKKNLLEKHILCLNKKIETLKQRKMFYLENLFI